MHFQLRQSGIILRNIKI